MTRAERQAFLTAVLMSVDVRMLPYILFPSVDFDSEAQIIGNLESETQHARMRMSVTGTAEVVYLPRTQESWAHEDSE
jgi:hypothetical protein